jgi:hypothetical protein
MLNPSGKLKELLKTDSFDGIELLKDWHLTDEEDWKIAAALTPYLDFTNSKAKRPMIVTELPERVGDLQS